MMRAYRTTRTALRALRRNPMRATLTTLGIIIGVGAVIAMAEIGSGSSKAIQQTIASMGADMLIVFPGSAASSGVRLGAGSSMTLTPEDCDAIRRECPAVRYGAPLVTMRAQAVYGNRNWQPRSIFGSSPEYVAVRGWEVAEGEMFDLGDVRRATRVCLVGQTIVNELFDGVSPLGCEIRVQNVALKVIGVLAPKGANMMGQDQDDVILMPWTTIKYRVSGTTGGGSASSGITVSSINTLNQIYPGSQAPLYPARSATQAADTPFTVRFVNVDVLLFSARSSAEIPDAMQQIGDLLRERHRLQPEEPDDFTTRDMTEMTKALASTTVLMTNLLLCVALISLVVGGVGIMNIMLVSVTERTREIGLRMAVGARGADILRQFLLEAVVLCLIGGAIGILMGHGGSRLINVLLHWPVETSMTAIVAAVGVSAAVGIVFGYYPAWKASRLDPIEALRYE